MTPWGRGILSITGDLYFLDIEDLTVEENEKSDYYIDFFDHLKFLQYLKRLGVFLNVKKKTHQDYLVPVHFQALLSVPEKY